MAGRQEGSQWNTGKGVKSHTGADTGAPASSNQLAWCAAKCEQMTETRLRCRLNSTATAPLLPPTPSTPQATEAVATCRNAHHIMGWMIESTPFVILSGALFLSHLANVLSQGIACKYHDEHARQLA